jgi:hypothetical protein
MSWNPLDSKAKSIPDLNYCGAEAIDILFAIEGAPKPASIDRIVQDFQVDSFINFNKETLR